MLPSLDGLQVCRKLKEESDVAIIMLTARVEEQDRLVGLDLGADDYVTKPFSPKELAARVRAVLRRTAREMKEQEPKELEYRDIKVDLRRRDVHVGGTKVQLTPTEFRLLAMLVREPDGTFTREQIIDRVLGFDFDGFDRTVDVHIANLRRKLEREGGDDSYVHTVYGVGYRFGDA
jgi:DNA-binding response OmpR family regulator